MFEIADMTFSPNLVQATKAYHIGKQRQNVAFCEMNMCWHFFHQRENWNLRFRAVKRPILNSSQQSDPNLLLSNTNNSTTIVRLCLRYLSIVVNVQSGLGSDEKLLRMLAHRLMVTKWKKKNVTHTSEARSSQPCPQPWSLSAVNWRGIHRLLFCYL